jgi:hypothetical protein
MPPTRCCWPTSCVPTRDAHRPLPADTELAQAIRVLARAQQDAVWARQQIGNQIRDLLNDFYPTAIVAFAELPSDGLARADSRAGRQADPRAAASAAGQGRPPPRTGS